MAAAHRRLLAGNWKMNLNLQQAQTLTTEVLHTFNQELPADWPVVLAPAHPFLQSVDHQIKEHSRFALSAQDVAATANGAHTGEVSAEMLASVGCGYALVGHSERRTDQQESPALLAQKLQQAFGQKLKPIFCVGETREQRDANQTEEVLRMQLAGSLTDLSAEQFGQLVLAYEPVWAIGTGLTATPEQAQEVHAFIRHWLKEKAGENTAQNTPILYGGSVKPGNAAELFAQPDIDGGLVGGASLDARSFVEIGKALQAAG